MRLEELIFNVFYSEEDGEWVCNTENWPSFSWLAKTPQEALDGYIVAWTDAEKG